MEWAQHYAEALGRAGGGLSLSPEEEEAVLLLARLVAHGTERRNAPLATFLAGKFAARRAGEGASPGQALAEAAAVAEDLLGAARGDEVAPARGDGGEEAGRPATQ